MQTFSAIDFETANEKRCSACAIGLVKYTLTGENCGTYQTLIKPHENVNYFNQRNTNIHGIHKHDVENSPEWDTIAPTIRDFIGDNPLVAHNMAFDGSILRDLNNLYGLPAMNNRQLCTLRLSRKLYAAQLQRHRLPDVYQLCFPGQHFNHHDALDDAKVCGLIFSHMIQKYGYAELEKLCP